MGRLVRAVWPIVRGACDAVTVIGIAGFAFLLALDQLTGLLTSLVAQVAPEFRLEAAEARMDAFGRVDLRGVRVRTADGDETVLAAKRMVVRFSPWSLRRRHLDEVRLDGVLVTPPATLPAFGGGTPRDGDPGAVLPGGPGASGATPAWSIGRLVARDGRFWMPQRGDVPGASFRFAGELRDLGTDPRLAERVHRVGVKDVVVTSTGGAPLLAMRGARVQASLAGVLGRRRLDEVLLLSPAVTLAGGMPVAPGGAADAGAGAAPEGLPPWTLGRLVVRDGRVALPPSREHPGVAFRVAADLRELATTGDAAARLQDVTARRVTVTLPGDVPLLTADAVHARFSLAGLLGRRVEELRLMTPALTVPDTLPAFGGAPAGAAPAAGWTLGRLETHDGTVRVTPSGGLPGVVGAVAFDLRELGTDAERAGRPQQVRMRNLRVRFPAQPTSIVIDEGSADFTVAGLLQRRELARLRIERGLLVLDRALRDRLTGGQRGGPTAAPAGAWSVAELDLNQLGIRLADLGPQIPDLTLMVRTRLTDVPLAPAGLARARTPQVIELSDISLDSPLDPFRPVIHVGNVFVEFTLADLLRRQIASVSAVAPTIYLGEDLIWYMNATRAEAAATPSEQPWTVRRLRAELGRIVVTFRGVDRVGLPLTFRTDASNVILGDLATLRLSAALEVPRQDYAFPGLDLELRGVEGEMRFDYPPGTVDENVVNTLAVAEIRWRDYRVHDGWFTATFDENGVNGKLGGAAYDGYVNGGATIPFQPGPMTGWASCTDLDLEPVAAAAAGSYLEMTGLVDVEGAVEMQHDRIEQASAQLDFKRPGRLSFPALDRLLERLPREAASWQRDLARIAVETFRDYPYTTGDGTLRFADARGEAHLGLDGELGKRQFDVYYYDEGAPLVVRGASEGE